ncbi:MAG TPA: hypothetical protein VE129_18950 [Thermoanaerobaculia bacterium]|nr:hypothetical protein [Thermoanaerobaculia bacterium]
MRSIRWRVALLAFAIGVLVLVVPVQGVRDRLGSAADLPPSSGAASYDDAAISLVRGGSWWRVEPDYSYFLVMHDRVVAGERGLPFLVSTYGPWGFIYRGCTPATYVPVLAVWLFLGTSFASVAWLSSRGTSIRPGPMVFWLATLLAGVAALPRELTLLLLPAGLAAGGDDEDEAGSRLMRALACAGAGLAALVKHNALALALIALGVLVARRVATGRRTGWEPLTFASAFLGFWFLAGQRLADLPPYLASAFAIVASYTEAASIPIEPGTTGALPAAALLLVVLTLEALAAFRRRNRTAAIEALGTAAVALILFKSGAVRAGNPEHLELAMAGLLTLALLRLPSWATALGRELGAGRVIAVGAGAAALVLVPLVPFGELARQVSAVAHPLDARKQSDARCAADLEAIQRRNPLPPMPGTVDLFQNRQSVVLAHGLDYRPRPVFQSYLATGGMLSRLNAQHLGGPQAARRILFEAWSIDGRLPALDDSLAWIELLRRYDVEAVSDQFALLELREVPRLLDLAPAGVVTRRFGEEAPVPLAAGAVIWVTARVEPSLLGRASAVLYKIPELEVRLRMVDGRVTRWRFGRSAGTTGFLLSPSVEGALDMALLVSRSREQLASKAVKSVSIGLAGGGGTSFAYNSEVEYRFREIVDLRQGPPDRGAR